MTANATAGESAIIIPVELPVAIKRLRDRMDASAAQGLPGHVALLYPFLAPESLDEDAREELRRLIGSHEPFSFVLSSVGRWPDAVYLAPQPAEPFSRLIAALEAYAGDRAHRRRQAEGAPHVTVARDRRPGYLEAAERALPAMLPVRGVAREAWLIVHRPGERWQRLWQLPLGG
ncbi:MAG: 2'-5' RNA ligase family protein [Chloroflexota bacterium]|nr:2'-5' RNA ligase family protein [Chloroflexota bacterium]